jgi:RimJ/RimL family protein N-acetyltransferase
MEFRLTAPTVGTVHYVLGEDHWNRGYITEVVQSVLE